MPETVEIKISAEPKFLKIIRLGVQYICEIIGFSSNESKNITLAVDEACSNIIKHAYEGPTTQPIHIACNIFQDRVEFLLRDYGKKSNIDEIKPRNLDEVQPGGLGVHLINSIMDEVVYDNSFDIGNQLKLVKFFQKKDLEC